MTTTSIPPQMFHRGKLYRARRSDSSLVADGKIRIVVYEDGVWSVRDYEDRVSVLSEMAPNWEIALT